MIQHFFIYINLFFIIFIENLQKNQFLVKIGLIVTLMYNNSNKFKSIKVKNFGENFGLYRSL